MSGMYAVYKRDGALLALSVDEAADLRLIQASKKFRSIGRALVAKHDLERLASKGGANG